MSEPAVSLDDVGYQNLRVVADRLLETTRVEYVDEGVLLVMNPPGIEHRRLSMGEFFTSPRILSASGRLRAEHRDEDVVDDAADGLLGWLLARFDEGLPEQGGAR